MERASQGGGTAFWWRATEPIPARPLPLDLPSDDAFVPAPPAERMPLAAKPAADGPFAASRQGRRVSDPSRRLVAPVVAPVAAAATPSLPLLRFSLPSQRSDIANGYGGRRAAFAAAAAGALVFAALSGFGTKVRGAPPLLAQAEAWAIAAGFGINEISVAGLKHTLDADVFRVLGPTSTTLAGLDVAAARARIEALPWVETATLLRILPDKLRIDIQERRASAVWLQGDRRSLVDASGRLLGHLGSFVPPDLPRIAGDGAPEAAADLFAALGRHVDLRSRVVVARRIGGRRWDLELAGGTRVKLAAADLGPSLVRLAALQHQGSPGVPGILDRDRQVIDLTLSGHIAVGVDASERNSDRQAATVPDPAQP